MGKMGKDGDGFVEVEIRTHKRKREKKMKINNNFTSLSVPGPGLELQRTVTWNSTAMGSFIPRYPRISLGWPRKGTEEDVLQINRSTESKWLERADHGIRKRNQYYASKNSFS
jgi:hypothetical protein